MERSPESDRWIRSIPVRTTPPSLKDNTGDVDRLIKGIEKVLDGGEVGVEIPLSRKIPSLLREHHYHVEVILCQEHSSWHVVDILPSTETVSVYGLAVDLGTSVIAVRLLDIATGEVKEETSFLNPQIQVGPDVLTRVSMVGTDLALDEGIGTCGKDGQSVPVGVGLPTVLVNGITVGGTKG